MAYQHQALLQLPATLRAHGITVLELDGWKENEQRYYWTDENGRHHGYQGVPNGWVWHHTASSAYSPFVKNSKGQTKANIFAGLWRGDDNYRLYQEGGGDPVLVICSAGPADYSNGSGVREVLTRYVAEDVRFHGPQRQSDDYPKWYGNRYYGGTEIVHRGDGSPLDKGVFRMVYSAMGAMMDYFEWSPWRHIGHLDHSRRKIDPRFEQGSPYTIGFMQDVAQGYEAGIVTPPPPDPPSEGDHDMNTVKYSDGFKASREKQPTVKAAQIMLASRGFADDNTQDGTCAADGLFGRGTERSVNAFKASVGLPEDGVCDSPTWSALEGW
jgi:hypothetical protein